MRTFLDCATIIITTLLLFVLLMLTGCSAHGVYAFSEALTIIGGTMQDIDQNNRDWAAVNALRQPQIRQPITCYHYANQTQCH